MDRWGTIVKIYLMSLGGSPIGYENSLLLGDKFGLGWGETFTKIAGNKLGTEYHIRVICPGFSFILSNTISLAVSF